MKEKSAYQIMVSILNNYKPSKEEKFKVNSFFFCRYLSGSPGSVFVGNFINRYYNEVPQDIQYDFAKQLLKGKITFIQSTKKDKNNDNVLENIKRYYKISQQYAIQYLELMDSEEREHFETLYDGQ